MALPRPPHEITIRIIVELAEPHNSTLSRAGENVLRISGFCGRPGGVEQPNPVVSSPDGSPIAGRIDAAPNALAAAVAAWVGNLEGRGKRPRSIASYRTFIESAMRERGWREPVELTAATILQYLDSERKALAWRSATYNRGLCVFRSLSKFMRRTGLIPLDGMEDAERAADDGGDGSRAATTDEARALIRAAWLKESTDRRCKGARSLYWACLFLAGCRAGEPEQWLWSDLFLDEPVPFIRWRKAISKNRKQVEVALCPELAGLLRVLKYLTHQPAIGRS